MYEYVIRRKCTSILSRCIYENMVVNCHNICRRCASILLAWIYEQMVVGGDWDLRFDWRGRVVEQSSYPKLRLRPDLT